ncbi:hypothetical protein D6C93_07595 [Aureobasidium pullulans]|nr:hypothetical protein D6C93_07595 [Aureobasidium pullulans]
MGYPWISLLQWQPFQIDALGLVTLLGSEEVNVAVGRLVTSRWLEYMPLLGAFVIASDKIREKTNAVKLYNLSSGITSTDIAPWFTRWMAVQGFEITRSIVYWEVVNEPNDWLRYKIASATISFCSIGLLMIMTALSGDWYGFTNALVVAISVIVRAFIVSANRRAIDHRVLEYVNTCQKKHSAIDAQQGEPVPLTDTGATEVEYAKTLVILPDSKAVTMFLPQGLIVSVFTRKPEPFNDTLYHLLRWLGWAAFAVHIVTIGMAQLVAQIYSVILLVGSTVLLCYGVGCDDSRLHRRWSKPPQHIGYSPYTCWIGSHLKATIFQWPTSVEFHKDEKTGVLRKREESFTMPQCERSERRQDLYVWLNLSDAEVESLTRWDLLPHLRRGHESWSAHWGEKRDLIRKDPVDVEALKNDAVLIIEKRRTKFQACDVEKQGH